MNLIVRQMRQTRALSICWLSLLTVVHTASVPNSQYTDLWLEYKLKHGKQYADASEEAYRQSVWSDNINLIRKHNEEAERGLHSFTMAVNKYSDLTMEEYRGRMLGYKRSPERKRRRLATAAASREAFMNYLVRNHGTHHASIPHVVDWRLHGYVTPVKDQGDECGACWAFTATGALEGQNFKKNHKLVSLSEQNLIDCVREHADGEPADVFEDDFGCGGADPMDAFYYVSKNGGIDTEKSYPYEAQEEDCRYQKKKEGASCTGLVELPPEDEHDLKQAVALIGPIAAGIDADHEEFKHYGHGVYKNPLCSSENLNHAVLIVGYGTAKSGEDYWLIKNSWGRTWGMNGYGMLLRNGDNNCGIATDCSFPTMD